jgi:hypothetical protein
VTAQDLANRLARIPHCERRTAVDRYDFPRPLDSHEDFLRQWCLDIPRLSDRQLVNELHRIAREIERGPPDPQSGRWLIVRGFLVVVALREREAAA